MVEASPKRSPLAALAEPTAALAARTRGALALRELPALAQIDLRGDPGDPRFLAGARAALGLDLPLAPNTTTAREGVAVLWLGPDEWLVVGPEGSETRLVACLRAALAGFHVSIVAAKSA